MKVANKTLLEVNEIPYTENIEKGAVFGIAGNGVSSLTHVIHKYPAKFIPHVPRWAIKTYLGRPSMVILDPFCGSGTTLVEGLISGHHVYGVDIDPLACLISKVKITAIEEDKLKKVGKDILAKINQRKLGKFRPKISTLNHWFQEDAINDLGVIRDVIEEFREYKDLYDFLIVCLSSIIRRVSNADNESQKTYVSHTNIKTPEKAKLLFESALKLYTQRVIELTKVLPNTKLKRKIWCRDVRELNNLWKENKLPRVDLAVTSPPYIKALDYIYTQMAEYFWVGDIFNLETQQKQNRYKPLYVGTKQIPAKDFSNLRLSGICEVDKVVKKIFKLDKKHAYIVAAYFVDMLNNISAIGSLLKPGGRYVIVVGNCNVSGIPVNMCDLVISCAREAGMKLEAVFAYEIRNRFMRFPRNGRGGIITHDWVLSFKS